MTSDKRELINNFKENLYKKGESIAIVGLGYVGLPLALTFAEKNFSVIGIDIDQQKVTKLKIKKPTLGISTIQGSLKSLKIKNFYQHQIFQKQRNV